MLIYRRHLSPGYDKSIPLFFTRSGSVWIRLTLIKDMDENPINCAISFHINNQSNHSGIERFDFSKLYYQSFLEAMMSYYSYNGTIFEFSIYTWPKKAYMIKNFDEHHAFYKRINSWFDKNGGYPTYLRLSSKIRAFIKHRLKFRKGLDLRR